MTFVHKTGDIFSSEMPALGHGVNVYGMMGAGIAKLIANRFPQVLPPYKEACKDGSLAPGGFQWVQVEQNPDFYILNLASQDKPGANARLDWLESSVESAVEFCKSKNLPGFAVPRIGAGIGGLDWDDEVKPLLERIGAREDSLTLEIWSLPDAK